MDKKNFQISDFCFQLPSFLIDFLEKILPRLTQKTLPSMNHYLVSVAESKNPQYQPSTCFRRCKLVPAKAGSRDPERKKLDSRMRGNDKWCFRKRDYLAIFRVNFSFFLDNTISIVYSSGSNQGNPSRLCVLIDLKSLL